MNRVIQFSFFLGRYSFGNTMADEFSLLKCSNIGCRETFKWREHLRRHKTKCSFTPKEVTFLSCLLPVCFEISEIHVVNA